MSAWTEVYRVQDQLCRSMNNFSTDFQSYSILDAVGSTMTLHARF